METQYVYVFIRTDIPLPDQLVQVGHVCLEAGAIFCPPSACHLVLLSLETREELLQTENLMREHKIRFQTFWEPDDDMFETAICTEPINGDLRKIFRQYKLWKYHEISEGSEIT